MPTRYNGTIAEKRALNALIALSRALNTVNARLTAARSADGMSLSQLAILEALLHCGPLCQRDLAEKLLVSGANITKAIDGLERDKLAMRRRDPADRRYITVTLTASGRQRIAAAFPGHARDVTKLFSVLSSSEQDHVRKLCRKLGTEIQGGKKP